MDKNVANAYEFLVPKDQLIADCVIIALYEKEKQIIDMGREMMKFLDKEPKDVSNNS